LYKIWIHFFMVKFFGEIFYETFFLGTNLLKEEEIGRFCFIFHHIFSLLGCSSSFFCIKFCITRAGTLTSTPAAGVRVIALARVRVIGPAHVRVLITLNLIQQSHDWYTNMIFLYNFLKNSMVFCSTRRQIVFSM
jgi:hypothetical protein